MRKQAGASVVVNGETTGLQDYGTTGCRSVEGKS